MRAPISGTVVQNQALRGAAISPGDVLYMLGTLEPVWITADIFEVDLARVQVGQELEAVTTAFPDDVFRGTISRISPTSILPPTRFRSDARCRIQGLKPQAANARAVSRSSLAPATPSWFRSEALVFDTDKYYAFVDGR